jgi:pseudouridine-5'-phosphate glycosidase
VSDLIHVSDEARDALAGGRGVVALETTLIAHGFPHPDGVEVGRASEAAVRAGGAVPATIGVIDGQVRVGLSVAQLERFGTEAAECRKLGPRDVAVCAVQGALGATTVGGTLAVCRAVGIHVMATGGLGGVHRGYPDPPDVSADLAEIARTPALIVSAGIKSLLDVTATMEVLETLGIPVLGYRTDTLPLFYDADGGPPVPARVASATEAAGIARAHWDLGGGGLLLGRPPDTSLDVAHLIEQIVAEAAGAGIRGQAVTPFVLGQLHERSDGRTRAANRELIIGNAALAADIAVHLAG